MSRNAPHPSAAVEGYYSKFDLPTGASVVLVICSVRQADADHRPHMVSMTHYPAHGTDVWQRQVWAGNIEMRRTGPTKHDFELHVPGAGSAKYRAGGTTTYDLRFDDFTFKAETKDCTVWHGKYKAQGRETSPEGWLTYLPLPLHWHVSSLGSACKYDFQVLNPSTVPKSIASSGTARVHQEKNWGNSFPQNHIWIQARDHDDGKRGLCLAGGQILGVQAYLIGYRSADLELDFKPPFAMQVLGWSPFLSQRVRWNERSFDLDVSSLRYRLKISAAAPANTFFTIGAPFPEGHRTQALAQSFRAVVDVVIYRRSWPFGSWQEVRREQFARSSLEFGGSYYGGKAKDS